MFPYIGGKAHHVKWMDPLFPEKFTRYVEVFGGAGWVMIKSTKISQAQERIYNDANRLLANVFECARTDPIELLTLMQAKPSGDRLLYRQYQQELFGLLDWNQIELADYDLAAKYLYLQTQVFSGTPLSLTNVPYFTEASGKYASKYDTLKRKLANEIIQQRLKSITQVEHLDCVDVIKKYDSPTTFFYVDPPYYTKEYYYSQDFAQEKHLELAQTLQHIQGKFALSYYDFPELGLLYPEAEYVWHRQSVYRNASTRSSAENDYKTRSRGTEILIRNFNQNTLTHTE